MSNVRFNDFPIKDGTSVLDEPPYAGEDFFRSPVLKDLAAFKAQADLILANRRHPDLDDVAGRVYTRDLFGGDA